MQNKQKISLWARLIARLTDYSLLYLVCVSISLFFSSTMIDNFYFWMGCATPFIWAPIEAVLIAAIGTTPGKFFLGLAVQDDKGEKLSMGASLKRSLFIGKRPGNLMKSSLRKGRPLLALLAILLFFGGATFLTVVKDFQDQLIPLRHLKQWINYTSLDERFKIEFPTDPKLESKKLEIPGVDQSLNYQEYSAEAKNIHYSVSYVDFPKKWRLLGAGTLLRKSLEILLISEKTSDSLINQNITEHKNFPALDYVLKQTDQEVRGRLILIGTTLYKLTVAYPGEAGENLQHQHFVESFGLPKMG